MPTKPHAEHTLDDARRVSILGAAFSANKGAASMLVATIQEIRRNNPQASIDVLTTYPEADKSLSESYDVRIVSLKPLQLALLSFPLGILSSLGSLVKIPRRFWARTPAMKSLLLSDVVVDLAGISFVSGRGVPTLGYNILMTGLPLTLGKPVVKASQAMGPFSTVGVRWAAKLIFPLLRTVVARGALTNDHLSSLGISNTLQGGDVAFLMQTTQKETQRAAEILPSGDQLFVGVVPSQVVGNYSNRTHGSYTQAMVSIINSLQDRGHQVVLIPHSIQLDKPPGKMNDLPLVEEICALVEAPVVAVTSDESPGVLRELISRCDLLVASRFHAMISSLGTATPTLVIGWSHKYLEVLAQFNQDDVAIDYHDLNVEAVMEKCDHLLANRDQRSAEIAASLPSVLASSRSGLASVFELIS